MICLQTSGLVDLCNHFVVPSQSYCISKM